MNEPRCPHCTRPVVGLGHTMPTGEVWHLSCAETLIAEKVAAEKLDARLAPEEQEEILGL